MTQFCCCEYYHFNGRKEQCNCEVHGCPQPSVESKTYFEQGGSSVEIQIGPTLKNDFPHSPIGWRERFDKEFWLHRVPSNTKQANDIKSFIAQEIAAAEERGYQRGQEDAFAGKIQNLKTLDITETVNVPEALREYFRKEGRNAAVDYIKENCPRLDSIPHKDKLWLAIDETPGTKYFQILPNTVLEAARSTKGDE